MARKLWDCLKRLDCYLTDIWTGRPYMYYSKVLGLKQAQYGGKIPWRVHFGQALVSRALDWVDPGHCQRAISAEVPK
jgi:hypothetical protein